MRQLYEKYGNSVSFMGVDPDSKSIEKAREENFGTKIRFKVAYAEDLPCVNNSCDYIATTFTFHHLEEEGKDKMLREAYRVLKPGGKFLLADICPPRGFWGKIVAFLSRNHLTSKENMEILKDNLLSFGFKPIKNEILLGFVEVLVAEKI